MHDPRHFCPSWKLSINDRVQFPGAARELMVGSVLPRDRKWMELADPAELQDMYFSSQAQANAAGAALVTRFSELSPDLEKMRKRNLEAEKNLSQALKEASSLKAKLDKAEKELDAAQVQLASTRSELDQEKAGVAKLREEHAIELSGTVSRERKKAVREFLTSEQFEEDITHLNLPILQVGCTRALDQVKKLDPPGLDLTKFKDYNPSAEARVDWLFDGYRKGHSLKELAGRSDTGAELEEVPLEEVGSPGRAAGKEPVA
ncbi:uncharacterized protein [Coffea arabica]|uniref:Uncharacterized protein n=1 Tax=Coffea arabica TaxID=13443 RepID=A0ABM4UA00_COFAR